MVTRWRFGWGWSEQELRTYLAELRDSEANFDERPERMTPEHGWTVDGDDQAIGHEPPGPPLPDGIFERAKQAGSATSDPRWVEAKDGVQDLIVVFPDNDPLSGYECQISARDGKVTRVGISRYIVD